MKKLTASETKSRFSVESVIPDGSFSVTLAEREDFLLPKRRADTHKYDYGRALILAGSVGFSGAPVLAANACEKSGAGLTTLMVPRELYPIAACRCDGAVVKPLKSTENGCASREALAEIFPALQKADACVIGPGFGTGSDAADILREVLARAACPLVLDADALTVCGRDPDLLTRCSVPLILTPHEGEFRRLGGNLENGRLAGCAGWMCRHPEQILVLKGNGTLVGYGKEISVNPTGTPAMAKGGSGDVLCGILCALLAQGIEPFQAAKTAVYLHGLAGELAEKALGEYCVTPSDLIRFLPEAFRSVCGTSS